MLKLHAWEHARAVLKGGGSGNRASLPDCQGTRKPACSTACPCSPVVPVAGRGLTGSARTWPTTQHVHTPGKKVLPFQLHRAFIDRVKRATRSEIENHVKQPCEWCPAIYPKSRFSAMHAEPAEAQGCTAILGERDSLDGCAGSQQQPGAKNRLALTERVKFDTVAVLAGERQHASVGDRRIALERIRCLVCGDRLPAVLVLHGLVSERFLGGLGRIPCGN